MEDKPKKEIINKENPKVEGTRKNKSSNKWIWWIIALAIIYIAIFGFSLPNFSSNDDYEIRQLLACQFGCGTKADLCINNSPPELTRLDEIGDKYIWIGQARLCISEMSLCYLECNPE